MTGPATASWLATNQQGLAAALAEVRAELEAGSAQAADGSLTASSPGPAVDTLDTLSAAFGLTDFERRTLLLCAGVELDGRFAAACAAAHGDATRTHPTWGLALAVLPGAHWSALAPSAPLRRWHLVEAGGPGPVTGAPLRIDERVLHHLVGVDHLDARLVGVAVPGAPTRDLLPTEATAAERVAQLWREVTDGSPSPVVRLCGTEPAGGTDVAAVAVARLGLGLLAVAAHRLPTDPRELDTLLRLLEREAVLGGYALLLDATTLDGGGIHEDALTRAVDGLGVPLLLSGAPPRRTAWRRPSVTVALPRPGSGEQRAAWQRTLGATGAAVDVDRLVARFDLGPRAIAQAAAQAIALRERSAEELDAALWEACRAGARPALESLATLVEPGATWDDLVVTPAQRMVLEQVAAHVDHRATVYDRWGLGRVGGARGRGTSVLFTGPSGTGKTLAAEVLARELRLDLYRIDLSQVVDKYIGETEKNLRRIFDAADRGSAVLLFDEADALFGKRSEVRDSHDRYANVEVSYLLQRMEAYRGLAVLTTNLRDALDPAFLRRLRFVVPFPFPDATLRAEIWRRAFPPETPTSGIDVGKLARLDVAGGSIRSIAVNAAFLAAARSEAVGMVHLLQAARTEYAKLDRPLTGALVADWT